MDKDFDILGELVADWMSGDEHRFGEIDRRVLVSELEKAINDISEMNKNGAAVAAEITGRPIGEALEAVRAGLSWSDWIDSTVTFSLVDSSGNVLDSLTVEVTDDKETI